MCLSVPIHVLLFIKVSLSKPNLSLKLEAMGNEEVVSEPLKQGNLCQHGDFVVVHQE